MNHVLTLWEYALWGAFGGVAVEAIGLIGAVKRTKKLPWNQPGEITLSALLLSVFLRLCLGVGLAVALAEGGQISGGVGAVAAGVAAPLILEQLGKQLSSEQVKSKSHAKEDRVIAGPELHLQTDRSLRDKESLREEEGGRVTNGVPNTTNFGTNSGQVSFAREVAFGLARSTPAFGGTAEL